MNCRNCKSNIDYNYLTNCPQCGCELDKQDLPGLDPSINSKKKSRWICRVTNLFYVLSIAFAGMLGGAMVLRYSAAFIYLAVRSPEPGAHCGEGMALGILSFFGGAFLGAVAGTALALNRPVFRNDR